MSTKKIKSKREALDILRTHVNIDLTHGVPYAGLQRVIEWIENK